MTPDISVVSRLVNIVAVLGNVTNDWVPHKKVGAQSAAGSWLNISRGC